MVAALSCVSCLQEMMRKLPLHVLLLCPILSVLLAHPFHCAPGRSCSLELFQSPSGALASSSPCQPPSQELPGPAGSLCSLLGFPDSGKPLLSSLECFAPEVTVAAAAVTMCLPDSTPERHGNCLVQQVTIFDSAP